MGAKKQREEEKRREAQSKVRDLKKELEDQKDEAQKLKDKLTIVQEKKDPLKLRLEATSGKDSDKSELRGKVKALEKEEESLKAEIKRCKSQEGEVVQKIKQAAIKAKACDALGSKTCPARRDCFWKEV